MGPVRWLAGALVVLLIGATAATAAPKPVTAEQVASPISVTKGRVIDGCSASPCAWPALQVTVNFTARVAITDARPRYRVYVEFTPTAPCSHGHNVGLIESTRGHIRAGQYVHVIVGISNCPGIVHGAVAYNSRTTHALQSVPRLTGIGSVGGALVGTFVFRVG